MAGEEPGVPDIKGCPNEVFLNSLRFLGERRIIDFERDGRIVLIMH